MKRVKQSYSNVFKLLFKIIGIYLLLFFIMCLMQSLKDIEPNIFGITLTRYYGKFMIFLFIPLVSIYYGIRTYLMTSKKIIPSILFCLSFIVIMVFIILFSGFMGVGEIMTEPNLFTVLVLIAGITLRYVIGIAFVLSVVSAYLTALFLKIKNHRL